MQNRYVGDISDFSKYLLLQYLCNNQELSLGINWFFNNNENDDFKKIKIPEDYYGVNNVIFNELKKCKSVVSIEKSEIFSKSTLYYSNEIEIGIERYNWFYRGLEYLKNQDVLFLDPDNGLEVSTYGKLHKNAIKYVFFDEIIEIYRMEKTIMIYQHLNHNHSFEEQINLRIKQLEISLGIDKESIKAISFKNDKRRFFLIVINKNHKKIICELLRSSSILDYFKLHQ